MERFIIAGLGNPGREYARHRHNVGFTVVNTLAQRHGVTFTRLQGKSLVTEFCIGESQVLLVKPQTFMNMSGEAVAQLVRYYHLPLERLLVVLDDLDLPIGVLRMRMEGSSGGQKGIRSIMEHLGSQVFPRLRVGIDRPPGRMGATSYVLHPFSGEQAKVIEGILPLAADSVETFVREGIMVAMDKFNS